MMLRPSLRGGRRIWSAPAASSLWPKRLSAKGTMLVTGTGCLLASATMASWKLPCAHASALSVPVVPFAAVLETLPDTTSSEISVGSSYRALFDMFYSWMHEVLEGLLIISRSAYLAFVFAPTLLTCPVLLVAPADSALVQWWWKLARICICTSGPCNIKFSQWVAMRPDLFPLVVCQQLQDLQTNAIRCSWAATRATLTSMFGPHWSDTLHLDLDHAGNPVVIGSGCVAQVLRGHLSDDTRPVAVKVIHPHVAKSIEDDIRIMRFFCHVIEMVPSFTNLGLSESVEQFSIFMESQLDLTIEAASLLRFRKNFDCDRIESNASDQLRNSASVVTFPQPMYPYVSRLALIEAFEEGDLMLHLVQHLDAPTRNKFATMGLDAILKMVFQDNFIHADLHMGNIICKHLHGNEYRMVMIDAGLIAELEAQDRRNFIDLFKAIVLNDGRRVGRLIIERSLNYGQCCNPENFEAEVEGIVGAVHSSGLSLGRVGVGDLLRRMMVSCYENNVKLEPRFVAIILAIGVVEGLGRRLDPDVDILRKAAPYVLRASVTYDK